MSDIMQLKGEGSDKKFDINNTRDSRGMTFLQVAAQNNDVGTAMLCLEFKADCSVTNKDGLTAVDYSSFFSFDAVTRLLTSKGAAVSSKYRDVFNGVETMSPIDTDMDWDTVLHGQRDCRGATLKRSWRIRRAASSTKPRGCPSYQRGSGRPSSRASRDGCSTQMSTSRRFGASLS